MRVTNILLVTSTILLASVSARGTGANPRMRHLQSVDNTDVQDEERANFDFSILDDVFHKLPEQFQRLRNEPWYLDNIFSSWRQGLVTSDTAIDIMRNQGLTEKAIVQFLAAYKEYLTKHPLF
ncbi:Secreted RxLR effector peptide protein [Phytophthora palmivora]|uniref:Secreted RxLR effector peptide protein n=1 Tax=Phytophthora palmivora TaxID=4796 RepID=A0A2P4YNK6_9STRA|nr:Secreted RxLR effector peptide protein [Phytophthora palmivora]